MKKCLIIMMLFSVGLAGIASAERGKVNYYRWDVNDSTTPQTVRAYQRDFSRIPSARHTVDKNFEFPVSNARSTNGLETPTWANGDYYGARFDGWIIPSETANYIFRIVTDDSGELWLSTDENRANVGTSPISRVGTATASASAGQHDWTDSDVTPSASISLTAGKAYYFYAVWKDGSSGDGCTVGWMNDKSIPAFTVIPLKNVSNTYPIGIATDASYSDSAAVEYELWQKAEWSSNTAADWLAVTNPDGKGVRLPADFSTLGAPTLTGLQPVFGYGIDRRADRYIYRQYGIIKLDAADTLTFGITSDDGSKLYIGNWWETSPSLTMLIDNDWTHGGRWYFNSIALPAGYVGIVFEAFEQSGNSETASVGFSSATVPWHTISSGEMYSRRYASRPAPASLTNVPVDTVLSWSKPALNEGATNILYFGEAGQPLAEVYRGTGSAFTPTLAADKGYQWRVDIEEPNAAHPSSPDILTGQVWSFTTQSSVAQKKLVAYWPLDSDLADASGNLKPGQYFSSDSSAPVFEPGIKGNALAINIAGVTKAQYAKLADVDVTALSTTGITGNAPRTIACWVKNAVPMPTGDFPDSDYCTIFGFTSFHYSMTSTSNANLTGRSFDLEKRGDQDQYCIHRYGAENNIQTIDGNWHFLVATFEPGSVYLGTVRWYADGNYVGTANDVRLWTQDIVHIGKRAHSNPLWRGWVDEARIYNYVLTPQEIAQLYWDAAPGVPVCASTNYPAYDFNKNCVVDTADLLVFAADWLKENMVP